MKTIKVLVVDDSAFMRKMIKDIIDKAPTMTLVGTARNGKEALTMIAEKSPDVVTMDIEMPVMDGITALKTAMKEHPVPIIMLSSLTQKGAEETLKALDDGAVDFIPKPDSIFKVSTNAFKDELISKIEVASKVGVKQQVVRPVIRRSAKQPRRLNRGKVSRIVAIGTSTGGPKALQSLVPLLSASSDAAFLIVQHMPAGFTKSLAERLDGLSELKVTEAVHGEQLEAGHCYIAPGDRHLKVNRKMGGYSIILDDGATVSGHKPSVDAMFQSLAEGDVSNVIAVIMTGMGADGAKGIKALHDGNAHTIAQDEKTCVVYGMPRAAVNLGGISEQLPLESLADAITKALEE